ncbi:efflux RND transporter permease subunit [Stenotrophobium rhamnosiphilum]|uniref:RND transporter n=1 Tax=Stenotrophobium rhamnosiphilum TaxID=2029166 RepID=A0A2T5MIV8_9GAMM|nr:efflux RND transporter permease subunit [Stenotrophobium rhamnosiphilum]PTU32523.1 RND transporter [Stenotrophobium rhamnosiphilum]
MWIVRVALQRPYTFIVMSLLIVMLGVFTIIRTPIDIFPAIRIPVVAVIWRYTGLPPEDMANRIVGLSERIASTTVNDIEHTESLSLNGTGVVKYFFQPNVNQDLAISQINSISQTLLKQMPPGISPPFILAFDASSVPILQLSLTSSKMSEAEIFDFSNSFMRTQLSTVAGASMPFPYGGAIRQVLVDLDPVALRAKGLTGADVTTAIGAQNLILPSGTQKIGDFEYFVKLNAAPLKIEGLNDIPIRADKNGTMIYVRDVAHVRDGSSPQTNIVRVDGHRSVLMSVLKTGGASTLKVVDDIKSRMPDVRAEAPDGLKIDAIGDQSIFVRASVNGVIHEGIIAAALTALMILLFLGSWRSTLIITVSIPLSVLASILCLSALGETINIMTLGGLALAVGILVDDATVAIENINWHLEQGKDVESAILDGAQQIAMPALVSTLCICIVFIPMFFLGGIAKYLFVPMAEAVVFAMLASYLLSRTLIPTLAMYWLKPHKAGGHDEKRGFFARFQAGFESRFTVVRERYHNLLGNLLKTPVIFAAIFMAAGAASYGLTPFLGQDFFPSVDAGQIKLHVRARSGTRIEDTAPLCDDIAAQIRKIIPAKDLDSIVDNIGVPNSGINLAYSTSAPIGPGDADIMITLKKGHAPSEDYVRELREKLPDLFPSVSFSFLPADIVSQILNFGLPSPLDIQISGGNLQANRAFAETLLPKLRNIPGAADIRIQQTFDYPQIQVDVDRTRAAQLGLTQYDVATNMLISLSGSFQTAPSYWTDPKSGVQYNVAVQTPQHRLNSLQSLSQTPISSSVNGSQQQTLANVASFSRSAGPQVITHYNARPTIDIYGAVQDTDLGTVTRAIRKIIADAEKDLPKGSKIVLRGQAETMTSSFNGLFLGLLGAVVLIYLLIVVNFQSWVDPLIIISALPAALSGIVWMLFLTHTTISVPALTGAIMCMGVATANSILVVSFARERFAAGLSALDAALDAGFSRFRPVLMTALAMIIGMVPMAMGFGEGGEQNAPLGRAVIGGLFFATIATLFFVPAIFSMVHGRRASTAR